MTVALPDAYWYGGLKGHMAEYEGAVLAKQHNLSNQVVEVVDIDLSALPEGMRFCVFMLIIFVHLKSNLVVFSTSIGTAF